MFLEIEDTIVEALKNEFKNDPILRQDMIMSSTLVKSSKELAPPHMPAIRVLFTDADTQDEAQVQGDLYEAKLSYTVFFFFKNFHYVQGSSSFNAYTYLQRILKAIKNLETPKGIVKPARIYLVGEEGFYAYAIECSIETLL